MNQKSNSKLTHVSQMLRNNMTKEEKHLWYDFLSKLPVGMKRQKVVGRYIVDFYCASARLVIELDGSQHLRSEGIEKDCERDAYLNSLGLTVLRYSNADIHNKFQDVCSDIWHHIFPFEENVTDEVL